MSTNPTETDATITPWEVQGTIDYGKVIHKFGSTAITPDLVARIGRCTKVPVHPFLRRGIFFSHRDMNEILKSYEEGKPFYLYTGRGPSSSSMHLGHLIPFFFTKYLQDAFEVPLVIQMTDDEKFLWKDLQLEECRQHSRENIKDIIACGYNTKDTFIFNNCDYMQHLYPVVQQVQRCITTSTAFASFGFGMQDHIGKFGFPAVQAAPAFSSAFPHIFGGRGNVPVLIPCAIDQDPYFRLTRDVAPRLKAPKCALIHSKFICSLRGMDQKMSASVENSVIYLTDSEETIRDKVMNYAFAGAPEDEEEHKRVGGNPDTDVSYQYLSFFMDDDVQLQKIREDFTSGALSVRAIKQLMIDTIVPIVKRHQAARALVTDEVVDEFLRVRKIECIPPKPLAKPEVAAEVPVAAQ
eukprot:TRINITY_DN13448_c0_g1_i1.p1 TRINITY_DN13448_c0_g1~~TRINITY_DN13448_c0_g1_i1.p1  ORF type:complete len:409 (+),score=89.90 TRINITY_DN13448_c0_g1_i1:90-1316(+)